jgi:hypothetical protein
VSTTIMASPLTSVEQLSKLVRWLPLVGLVAAFALGRIFGVGIGFLIAAGTALMLGIWGFWSSLQNLSGDAPLTLDEALSLGAPTVEEEQKRAVLRALKDLEYERAVGKISEADYTQLSERYRQDAKRLLRLVERDLTPERERAERILKERLAELEPNGVETAAQASADASGEATADATAAKPREPEQRVAARAAGDPREASTTAEDHE